MFGSCSADETMRVFSLSAVFLSPRSLFLFQIRDSSQTQRFREIIKLFSSSVKIVLWVSFSGLVWFHPLTLLSLLVDFSPEAPCSRSSRPRTPLLPFKRLFEVTVIPRNLFFWWAEYKDVLWSIFFTVLTESRGSNMKENIEALCWYLIVRVGETASWFLHLRGSGFFTQFTFLF